MKSRIARATATSITTAGLLVALSSIAFGQTCLFQEPTTFTTPQTLRGLAVGDLNGDSIPDLALANELLNNVSILLGDGAGAFCHSEL